MNELLGKIVSLEDSSEKELLVAFLELNWAKAGRLSQLAKCEVWKSSALNGRAGGKEQIREIV